MMIWWQENKMIKNYDKNEMMAVVVEAIADCSITILHLINLKLEFNPAIQHSSTAYTIQIKSIKSNQF